MVGGSPYYRHYTISTDTWSSKVFWDSDVLDFRDVWGGKMDNDSIIVFTSTSANGAGGDWSSNIFYKKCDAGTMTFGSRVAVTGTVGLQRGTAFGKLTYMGTPGSYAIALNQYNITGTARVTIDVLITSDYFNTYTVHNAYDGTLWLTESCVAYLGSGKMCIISRAEQLGGLYYFESTNSGSTWTARGFTNLGWYNDQDKIPFLYGHNGLLDVAITDRSSLCVSISRNNNPDNFFGAGNTLNFNPEQMYFYNDAGSSSNPNLGYVSEIEIAENKWMVCWARETGTNVANIWYSLDDQIDVSAPTAPLNIRSDYIGTNFFRLDIDDYGDHMKNIRYFQIDVSVDAGFGSFITAKVNTASAVSQTIQNITMKGPNINIYGLTAATTYYARVRAVNNVGSSSYYSKTVTTL